MDNVFDHGHENGPKACPDKLGRKRTKNLAIKAKPGNGETRTRTGDTTIFSRVLYQLSYLAVRVDPSVSAEGAIPARARS